MAESNQNFKWIYIAPERVPNKCGNAGFKLEFILILNIMVKCTLESHS